MCPERRLEKLKEEMDRNKEEMAEELDRRCKEEMGSYKEEMERYKEEQIKTKAALDCLLQQVKPVLSSSSSLHNQSLKLHDILIRVLLSQILPSTQ